MKKQNHHPQKRNPRRNPLAARARKRRKLTIKPGEIKRRKRTKTKIKANLVFITICLNTAIPC